MVGHTGDTGDPGKYRFSWDTRVHFTVLCFTDTRTHLYVRVCVYKNVRNISWAGTLDSVARLKRKKTHLDHNFKWISLLKRFPVTQPDSAPSPGGTWMKRQLGNTLLDTEALSFNSLSGWTVLPPLNCSQR